MNKQDIEDVLLDAKQLQVAVLLYLAVVSHWRVHVDKGCSVCQALFKAISDSATINNITADNKKGSQ